MVVGECMPPIIPLADTLLKMLGELHEFYVESDNTAIAAFHGEVKDGAIKLPDHTHAAFNGKKVFVGVVWSKPAEAVIPIAQVTPYPGSRSGAGYLTPEKPECAHCANNANSEICSECRDYDHFKPEPLHPEISEARREAARMDK